MVRADFQLQTRQSNAKEVFKNLGITPAELRGFCTVMNGDGILSSKWLAQESSHFGDASQRLMFFKSQVTNAEQFLRELALQGEKADSPAPLAAVDTFVPEANANARAYLRRAFGETQFRRNLKGNRRD